MADTGRPTVMTPEVIGKLEDAFSVGATDLEACFVAGIGKDALYDYQKKHPEFSERKEALKKMVNYKAKKVISGAIESGDKTQANWWLERKGKDDGFSSRTELTGGDGKDLPSPIMMIERDVQGDDSDNQD